MATNPHTHAEHHELREALGLVHGRGRVRNCVCRHRREAGEEPAGRPPYSRSCRHRCVVASSPRRFSQTRPLLCCTIAMLGAEDNRGHPCTPLLSCCCARGRVITATPPCPPRGDDAPERGRVSTDSGHGHHLFNQARWESVYAPRDVFVPSVAA
eukprot:970728-Prorocentrum_minimum.AAC.4